MRVSTPYFLLLLFTLLFFFFPSCLLLGCAFLFLNAPGFFFFLLSRLLFKPLLLFHHSLQCTEAALFLCRCRGGLIILLCFLLLFLLFCFSLPTIVAFIFVFICCRSSSLRWGVYSLLWDFCLRFC